MKYIILCILIVLCSCAEDIYKYELKSPAITGEIIATNVALLKRNRELFFAHIEAIQRNICLIDQRYLKAIQDDLKEKFDIDFGKGFCKINNV